MTIVVGTRTEKSWGRLVWHDRYYTTTRNSNKKEKGRSESVSSVNDRKNLGNLSRRMHSFARCGRLGCKNDEARTNFDRAKMARSVNCGLPAASFHSTLANAWNNRVWKDEALSHHRIMIDTCSQKRGTTNLEFSSILITPILSYTMSSNTS